jgi:hypothetical protein
VEGEFDALLLGQQLSELAAVVTLGSASARPDPVVFGSMLAATAWFTATDNDPAGDRAAAFWPTNTRRVLPPSPWKDWTDARRDGLDLRDFWADTFAGRTPKVFSATWLNPEIGQADPDMEAEAAWRAGVAALPHEEWARWRRRSGEIQAALGHRPEADEIRQADHQAAAEVLAPCSTTSIEDVQPIREAQP